MAIFDTITMLKLYVLYFDSNPRGFFVSISTLGYKSDKSFIVNIRKSCCRLQIAAAASLDAALAVT